MTTYSDNQDIELKDLRGKTGRRIDGVFCVLTLLILVVGLVMLMSASYARAYYETGNPFAVITRQAALSVIGIIAMFGVSLLPEKFFQKTSTLILISTLVLLVLVLIIGEENGGGKRWINIGFQFQPSELAKLSVILAFAKTCCSHSAKLYECMAKPKYKNSIKYRLKVDLWHTVIPYVFLLMIVCVLLVIEPHVSACIIFIIITGAMMWQAGTKVRYLLVLVLIAAFAAVLMYKTGFPSGYVRERVVVWKDPWAEKEVLEGDTKEALQSQEDHQIAEDKGYQTRQSLIAIGSGGWTGLGLGQSRQKHLYLPEEHNDFIFAIVCEELGWIGGVLILFLFATLVVRGYWLAIHSSSKFSALVIAGITTQLAVQVFLNVSVATNLIPATGISLPFFSYGGTALICQMGGMGIILALSKNQREV